MFDFIPIEYYTTIYFNVLLLVMFILKTKTKSFKSNMQFMKNISVFLLFFTVIYMGFRPVSGRYFGDMSTYATTFERYQAGEIINFRGDFLFNLFIKICSAIMSVQFFFLVCATLYTVPLWFACKKWFSTYYSYAFIALIVSLSFWAYGANGIRNGIATSLFLFALSRDKMFYKVLFIFISIGIHNSLLIPTTALIITYFYNNSRVYFFGWLLAIPVSLISGSFWEGFFAGLIEDERVSYLTDGNINNDDFSSTGFRWDFLIYSAAAVYCAYFFIYKKSFKDKIYNRLVGVYLISNAFWILVIRANFSNRFAYLSWFMMGIIIVYPFLIKIQMKKQLKVLGFVLLAYFSFTYFMNVILA